MKTYAFMTESPQELARRANETLKNWDGKEMTPEEIADDDAEGGYFEDDDDN